MFLDSFDDHCTYSFQIIKRSLHWNIWKSFITGGINSFSYLYVFSHKKQEESSEKGVKISFHKTLRVRWGAGGGTVLWHLLVTKVTNVEQLNKMTIIKCSFIDRIVIHSISNEQKSIEWNILWQNFEWQEEDGFYCFILIGLINI